jgi:ariadne-1
MHSQRHHHLARFSFGFLASPGIVASGKSGIRMSNAEDLRPELDRRVKDVTEVLDVPEPAAMVLLSQYNWSKEELLEAYMANADKLLKAHGVYRRCGHALNPPSNRTKSCAICYDDDVDEMLAMPCGHEFCLDCWHDFSVAAIAEGPVCINTTCPHAGCPEKVTAIEFERSLGKQHVDYQKFLTYQIRSFVESNGLSRWCPGAGCERVACAVSAAAMESEGSVATCDTCATSFCLRCGQEPHAPASCPEIALWMEKCRNESETANWILANTKSCPKCMSRIEKNQGCNHMSCQRCKYEFCWICMGDWSEHGANTGGYYKCNKYDSDQPSSSGPVDQSDAAKAKRDLDRYLHYYKRYHAHSEAQAFARKQLKETEGRMVLLQESSDNGKWSDVEFLKTANEQLVECRRVLKYTYTFAYYLDPRLKMQRERFEHHQEMLERFTENLSELSERPLAEMDRTDVVNQTRVVDRFMRNILKYVEDGMDEV